MSSETLRRAAKQMNGSLSTPFLRAVAVWLDDTAQQLEATHPNPACDLLYDGDALAVARAYLREVD